MPCSQADRCNRYARRNGARAAWFAPARHVADLIAKIGLIGANDRLIAFADEFEDAFRTPALAGRVIFAPDPASDTFLRLTGADAVCEDGAPERSGDHVPAGSPASYAYPAGIHSARTFWLVPSIGGVGLRVADIPALASAAKRVGAVLMVDNTVPGGFGCHPLELGAHIAFEALDRVAAGRLRTKAVAVSVAPQMRGRRRHAVAQPEAEDAYRLLAFSLGLPEQPSPALMLDADDLEAVASGLETVDERMQRHADHARALAEYLACHPRVGCVRYPGLASHPDHALAERALMHGFGPAVDFSLLGSAQEAPCAACERFVASCASAHRDATAGGADTRMSVVEAKGCACVRIFAGTDDPYAVIDGIDRVLPS